METQAETTTNAPRLDWSVIATCWIRRMAGRARRLDGLLDKNKRVWIGLLCAVGVAQLVLYRSAVGGNWLAGGRDMLDILPDLRTGSSSTALGWLSGPWVGHRI